MQGGKRYMFNFDLISECEPLVFNSPAKAILFLLLRCPPLCHLPLYWPLIFNPKLTLSLTLYMNPCRICQCSNEAMKQHMKKN